jgi:hypothetical protein
MKIINKTGFPLSYVVTFSGYTLSDAFKSGGIIASGYVNANDTASFAAQGTKPAVYVGRQVTDGNSSVSVTFEEI